MGISILHLNKGKKGGNKMMTFNQLQILNICFDILIT